MELSMRMLPVAVMVISLSLTGTSVRAQQGDDCREAVRATASVAGTSVVAKLRAREMALGQWKERVSERYGSGFRTWLKAHEKTVNCNTRTESTMCTAEAFSCRNF